MAIYIYDGSFEGLLSCVFESYRTKTVPQNIAEEQQHQFTLLDNMITVPTNDEYAARVLKSIDARTNDRAAHIVYQLFLSELPQIEMLIFNFIAAIIHKINPLILDNFANEYILKASQIERMMHREVHRMHAFVRFQKAKEGIFYAAIDPDFNVLPLIGDHFERRYADQPWVIFDTKRHYGLHYDLTKTTFVTLDDPIFNISTGDLKPEIIDEAEKNYQALWENYFQSVNIQERKNPKLHIRHVPKRYWKYLVEKRYATRPAQH
jgi:probable DNA metabolism protein